MQGSHFSTRLVMPLEHLWASPNLLHGVIYFLDNYFFPLFSNISDTNHLLICLSVLLFYYSVGEAIRLLTLRADNKTIRHTNSQMDFRTVTKNDPEMTNYNKVARYLLVSEHSTKPASTRGALPCYSEESRFWSTTIVWCGRLILLNIIILWSAMPCTLDNLKSISTTSLLSTLYCAFVG